MDKSLTDIESLIKKFVLENDEKAFNLFFKGYYAKLIEFCLIFVKEEQAAREIVSDVFYRILQKKHKLLQIENIKSYLFLCCKNQSLSYLKKRKIDINRFLSIGENQDLKTPGNPESELYEKELINAVNQVIKNLPPRRQMVFRLIKDEGLSYKEVADLLDISPKTVDNHLAAAIAELRKMLKAHQSYQGRTTIMKIAQIITLLALVVIQS